MGPFSQQSYVDTFLEELGKMGFSYFTNPYEGVPARRKVVFGNNSGLLIASKLPIVSSKAEIFKEGRETLNFKGFLRATVELKGGEEVHFLTCHLNSRKKPNLRKQQLKQLYGEVERLKEEDLRARKTSGFVIAGDWNICSKGVKENDNGREYNELTSLFHPLIDIFDHADYQNKYTYLEDQSFRDHCFLSPHYDVSHHHLVDWRTKDDFPCSDHLGLSLTLTF